MVELRDELKILKEALKEAEELNSSLKLRLNDSLKELEDKELLLKKESKTQLMSSIIKMIAHQWRQPLSTISLIMSGLHIKSQIGEVSKEDIQKSALDIDTKVKDLSSVIDSFASFFNDDDTELELINIKDIIESSLTLYEELILKSDIKVNKTLDESINTYSIKNTISHILNSIILNAIESLEEKSDNRELTIGLGGDNDVFFIRIHDNGAGVVDEMEDIIFDPYSSTKDKNARGLGLYVTKLFVHDKLDGDLYFNNIDNGVEFIVEIPLMLSQ